MKHLATAAVLTPMLAIAIPMAMARTPGPLSHQASFQALDATGSADLAPMMTSSNDVQGMSPAR